MKMYLDKFISAAELVSFHCAAVNANSVCLVGDFNNWNPSSHPMERQADGSWRVEIPLSRTRHYYQFLVDGEPVLDPEAMCSFSRQRESKVSLIALC
jgi:1,4-alpha-glucan branching enzyme